MGQASATSPDPTPALFAHFYDVNVKIVDNNIVKTQRQHSEWS